MLVACVLQKEIFNLSHFHIFLLLQLLNLQRSLVGKQMLITILYVLSVEDVTWDEFLLWWDRVDVAGKMQFIIGGVHVSFTHWFWLWTPWDCYSYFAYIVFFSSYFRVACFCS